MDKTLLKSDICAAILSNGLLFGKIMKELDRSNRVVETYLKNQHSDLTRAGVLTIVSKELGIPVSELTEVVKSETHLRDN